MTPFSNVTRTRPDPPVSGPAAERVDLYYLCQKGTIYGPADLTTIAAWIGEGRVTPRDWLFVPSIAEWKPILEVPQMSVCFYSDADQPQEPPPGFSADLARNATWRQEIDFPDTANPAEKRHWVRLPLSTTMKFSKVKSISGNGSGQQEAYTSDISEGGLGFFWYEQIDPGETLYLRVNFPSSTFHAAAKVVHCFQKTKDFFLIGVAFQSPPEPEREKIRDLIRSCLRKASCRAPGS